MHALKAQSFMHAVQTILAAHGAINQGCGIHEGSGMGAGDNMDFTPTHAGDIIRAVERGQEVTYYNVSLGDMSAGHVYALHNSDNLEHDSVWYTIDI